MKNRPNPRLSTLTRSEALQLLGLDASATESQIRSAFRAAAKQHHPDVGGDAEMFKRITEAHDVLKGAVPPAPEAVPTSRAPARTAEPDVEEVRAPDLQSALRQVIEIAHLHHHRLYKRVRIRIISRTGPYEMFLEDLLFDAGTGRDILSGPAPLPTRSAWDED